MLLEGAIHSSCWLLMVPGEALTKGGERGAWLVKTEKNGDLTLGSGVVDTTGDNMEVS